MHIDYWAMIKHNKMARVGFALLGFIAVISILGPLVTVYDPWQHTTQVLQPPSGAHWLGTNDVGQDIFTRLVWGGRTSLAVALGVALFSSLLAVLVGTTAAMAGGWWDKLLMRITDAMLAIPPVLVIILVAAYLRPGLPVLILILSLVSWPGGARVIRAQTLTLKQRAHVYASRTFGARGHQIFLRHILPDLAPVITVGLIQGARRAVVAEAGLAFLGISHPGTVSWGMMIHHALGFSYLNVWQWWLIPAGVALSLTVLSFAYICYAVEEILEPRLKAGGREVA